MYEPHEDHRRQLEASAPGVEWRTATDETSAARAIVDADAVLGNRYFLQSLPYAGRLRWMQSNSMGVDVILRGIADRPELCLTSVRGVYDAEMADHAMAMILALLRGLPEARDAQRRGVWERRPLRRLTGLRVLILGWGGVGRSIARRLRGFGCDITGVRRCHTGAPSMDAEGFLVGGPDAWRDRLGLTDILILALPETPLTRHIVAKDELRALPADALVINVSRGGTLDEKALQASLSSGRLRAALDVLEEEPPGPGHWVWTSDRLLLTPHVGRSVESPPFQWEPIFVENVRRFHDGLPLLNIVDKTRGY